MKLFFNEPQQITSIRNGIYLFDLSHWKQRPNKMTVNDLCFKHCLDLNVNCINTIVTSQSLHKTLISAFDRGFFSKSNHLYMPLCQHFRLPSFDARAFFKLQLLPNFVLILFAAGLEFPIPTHLYHYQIKTISVSTHSLTIYRQQLFKIQMFLKPPNEQSIHTQSNAIN